MRFKFNPLTFEQKLALRRSAEDAINAMNPHWGEFRKAATAPAIISLLDSLDEQAQELHKTKMALADAGCALVEWKQRVETTEQQLEEMTIYRDNAIKKIVRANERMGEIEKQNLEKPSWDSHNWPQIVQSAGGHWFGVKAGWEMSVCNNWKGADLSLRSDDGKFLKYGKPSDNWRQSLEQRPVTTRSITDIIAERQRQVTTKGWTPEHDDEHVNDEIAAFAALYAMPEACRDWDASETGYGDTFGQAICPLDWVPKFGDRRRELVKAGALIVAEIERLDRISNEQGENHE